MLPTPPLAFSTVEIIVAVVFVVGGIIKHFLEKATVNKDPNQPTATRTPPLVTPRPDPANPAAPRSLETAEEKAARRLMEALGRPVNRPQVPQPTPPPPPPFFPPTPPPPLPPVVIPRPPPLPVNETAADPAPRHKKRKPREQQPAPAPFSAASGVDFFPPTATTTVGGTNPTSRPRRGPLLGGATRGELRRAILLREILGPPRALAESGDAGPRG